MQEPTDLLVNLSSVVTTDYYMRGDTMRTQRGFTLIELLVVIAIIAILAAILFPVFAKAREKARQSSCLSNAKQLELALMQYAQDYDETLPGLWQSNVSPWSTYTWDKVVAPYIKNTQVLMCPSRPTGYGYSMIYGTGAIGTGSRHTASYLTYNGAAWGSAGLGLVARPAEIVILAECWPGQGHLPSMGSWQITVDEDGDGVPESSAYGAGTVQYDYNGLEPRHNDGANIGFFDGHAKWYHKRTYQVATFWPAIGS